MLASSSNSPSDFTRGYDGGVADAQTALRLHGAAGGPGSAPIFFSVDEPIDATQCGGRESCKDDGKRCMTHELWANLNAHIFGYLRSVTLAELVAQQSKSEVTVLQDQRPQGAPPRAPVTAAVA